MLTNCSVDKQVELKPIIENYIKKEIKEEEEELSLEDIGYYCQNKKGSLGRKIDELKIQQDKELIEEVNVLNGSRKKIKETLLNKKWPFNEFDIGNDLMVNQFRISGNYITIYITIIDYRDKVIEYQVKYDSYEEIFGKEYYKLIKVETVCDYGNLRYIKWNLGHLEEYEKKYPNVFWLIPNENHTDKRDEVINYFTYYIASENDRFQIDHVKWEYWKKAMDHVRYLIVNKDMDALYKIINSPNREGRIIGSATLSYLSDKMNVKLPFKIDEKIKEIVSQGESRIKSGIDLSHWGEPLEMIDIKEEFERFLKEK